MSLMGSNGVSLMPPSFKVAPDDLKLVLDVFADRVSFYANTAQDLL